MNFSDLLPPFEQRGMDLSLERMQRALNALHHPCRSVPAVQVVGTNGKGSIASFVHSAMVHAGIRSGGGISRGTCRRPCSSSGI